MSKSVNTQRRKPDIDESITCYVCGGPSEKYNYVCDACRDNDNGVLHVGVYSKGRDKSVMSLFALVGINDYADSNIIDVFGYDPLTGVETMIRLEMRNRTLNDEDIST